METSTVQALPAHSGLRKPLPSPDFLIIEGPPDDNTFIVGPCHRAAAVWLHGWAEPSPRLWVGEGVSLERQDVCELITSATRAGFSVRLHLQVEPRHRLLGAFSVAASA